MPQGESLHSERIKAEHRDRTLGEKLGGKRTYELRSKDRPKNDMRSDISKFELLSTCNSCK